MSPSDNERPVRFSMTVRDWIYSTIFVVGMIGAWVSGQVTVAEVKAWGEGPRGRLYMLEEDVKKHHTDTTKEMENKIQADHDMLVALEGKIQRLTEVTDTQNKLYFELLKELRSRQR